MAEIRSYGFVRHLRADPSAFVLQHQRERVRRKGRGLAFWFLPLSSSLVEIPIDDRELSIGFHGRTADFQDVNAQGVVTYRVAEPEVLAERVDFTIDAKTGVHLRQPLEKLALFVSQLAQQHAFAYIAQTPVREVLSQGPARIREVVEAALTGDVGLRELGLRIASVRIAAVRPTPELEKALEAPTRERIAEAADEAAFSRRAMAVDKERAIQENALQNQIELARREEQLIAQRGQNARREATLRAESERITAEGNAERVLLSAAAEADRVRAAALAAAQEVRDVDGARLDIERARLEILRTMPTETLLGMAAQELAGKLTRIEHLSLSPDALGPLLTQLVQAGTRRLEAPAPVARK